MCCTRQQANITGVYPYVSLDQPDWSGRPLKHWHARFMSRSGSRCRYTSPGPRYCGQFLHSRSPTNYLIEHLGNVYSRRVLGPDGTVRSKRNHWRTLSICSAGQGNRQSWSLCNRVYARLFPLSVTRKHSHQLMFKAGSVMRLFFFCCFTTFS